ncbi:MAG: LLM class flavin-dependent oxidoreductase [Candidatus Binatus sp.]|uniref:LLM class flavin-dependent oxidoreductase n=1 Tax=Candidatus Binatus sp. TaxID=2811406 RepID=UPI0027157314|nr:LLM class flavin-dependent oxidoreductase [Candidatus Binatus sp.]MDO8434289.1 LLM class flavin-dependent oxidoreductase [Candidatus Binatus sp.]
MRNNKKMHLAQFLMHSPTYHSLAMWRHPRTAYSSLSWDRPELYQHIAQVCERGKFDMVFFADVSFISDTYTGSLEPAIRYATQAPAHDPIPLLSWLGAVTSTIGLGGTFSISHQQPFYVARLWATLDHLTRGRAAWNIVTSINHNESANYGAELMEHNLRYERAEEFMEVCIKLWNSWDKDAVVMDRERGVFADPAKVRRIEHEGRFFKSRGPLTVTRSPQNGPAIIQAGASSSGRAFAAKYAEAIFAVQPFADGAREYYADVKGRMENAGRNPDHCKILFGVQPIVGRTAEEAREKQAFHNSLVPVEAGLTILSGHLDYDFSRRDLDQVMEHSPEFAIQGLAKTYSKVANKQLTVRDVAQMHGQSVSLPQIVGNPEQVVDQLEAYYQAAGGDGFMLSPIYTPGAIEEFVDMVVPVLQRRGLFRSDYAGKTQREHLLQDS